MPNAHSARSYLLWNHCVVKLFKLTAMIFTFSFVFALELYCSQKWKGKSGEFSRFIFETTKTKPTSSPHNAVFHKFVWNFVELHKIANRAISI